MKMGLEKLSERAAAQLSVVTVKDCVACRVDPQWVRDRVQRGEWLRLHRGVYKVGGDPPSFDQAELAALYLGGPNSALSHFSAARRLGLAVPQATAIHLSTVHSNRIRVPSGIEVWRCRDLRQEDMSYRGLFRVTRVGRTILDLVSLLSDEWLRATIDSALRLRHSNLKWIQHALATHGKGRDGTVRLREALTRYGPATKIPESVLESFGAGLLEATGHLPQRQWNMFGDGGVFLGRADFAWPEVRLGLELDSWQFHGTPSAFENDRARDVALAEAGWQVLRFTWKRVMSFQPKVITQVRNVYAGRAGMTAALSQSCQ